MRDWDVLSRLRGGGALAGNAEKLDDCGARADSLRRDGGGSTSDDGGSGGTRRRGRSFDFQHAGRFCGSRGGAPSVEERIALCAVAYVWVFRCSVVKKMCAPCCEDARDACEERCGECGSCSLPKCGACGAIGECSCYAACCKACACADGTLDRLAKVGPCLLATVILVGVMIGLRVYFVDLPAAREFASDPGAALSRAMSSGR